MAQRVYATVADYEDFTGGEHEPESENKINAKLRRASLVIDGLTRLSRYDVDEDGMPIDPDIDQAFRDATCAQVAYWGVTDDETGGESVAGAVRIGSVSLGGAGASGAAQTKNDAASSRFAPEAIDILRTAGLSAVVAHT